jgi:hypothetical protein
MKLHTMNFKPLILGIVFAALSACNQSPAELKEKQQVIKEELQLSEHKTNGVYFVNLKDGEKVKSPIYIQMGVVGMTVEPAGKLDEGKGHHHLIIDGSFIEKGQMVPKDETHIHFGKGQIADTLELAPGPHTLTLQFANGVHQSYGKDWSNSIQITVEK